MGGIMKNRYVGLFTSMFLMAATCAAQQPAEVPFQIPNPHYVTVQESIDVDAPVDKTWERIGKFCDITEWMNTYDYADCMYLSGAGGVGTVRSILNEVVVGQTQYSYTYTQPPRKDTPYNLSHGTLAAEALTPTSTQLTYTIVRDDSMFPDDATRSQDMEARRARLSQWMKNMKVLAEGGKLPPKPAGSPHALITTPFLNPSPQYASLPMSIVVEAPAHKVWARVGKDCDIGEWGFKSCDRISGKEGEVGVVRTIGHSIIVGRTKYSYTYTKALLATGLYPMYHGTLEARPLGSSRTTLYYTLFWDSSALPDDAARQTQVETYGLLFEKMLRNMKKLAEGGALTKEDKQAPVDY
jgi:hypothetical protein